LKTKRPFSGLWKQDDGLAAIEAALVFPLLLTMLMGTYDLGNAILANTKVVRASQVVADLVTRKRATNNTEVLEAIEAGKLALEPLNTGSFGVDIASIEFDDEADSSIIWRRTVNMTPDPSVLNRVEALAEENAGVVVVSVRYTYQPFFAHFLTGDISMMETAFARGRKSAVVRYQ